MFKKVSFSFLQHCKRINFWRKENSDFSDLNLKIQIREIILKGFSHITLYIRKSRAIGKHTKKHFELQSK